MSSGVHIPADVRRFLEFTLGLSWPESDDQGLVALWKAWEAFEDAAGVFEAASRAAGTAVPEVLEGATGEFFARFLSTTISDGVAGLRESSGELGRMAQNAAADVYKTKVMFVVFAAFTLASVLHLLATLIGALFTGVVIAAARVALTAIWKALVTRLGQLSITGGLSQATKAALLKAAKDLALKTGGFAAFGAALMGGTDFGVQARQIADGDRDGWDIRSLTSSLVGGALGGAFAGVFHSAAGGIRRIAFDLRDGLASREPGGLFADGVTIGQVTTALDGPLSALGDLVYATGQMITVIATAPLINLALGAPAGNPALGALGALSRYGGGRRGGSSGGGTLDSVHPPVLPDFSIPAKDEPDTKADPATEKPTSPKKPATGETGHGPEKAELPPPYLATAEGADLRAEKTPAYTTSPHVLGSLYTTTPIAPAVAAPTPGSVPAAAPAVTTAAVPAPAMTSAPAGIPASAAPVSPAAVTAGHSPATAAFLAGSAPPSLPEAAHTSAGQDAPRPLRTVALPGRGGVAFVSDLHAGNVRAAFPEPTPGVYRVVVESGDDDTFILPGHDDLATSAPRHHLVTALAGLPPRLATWNRDTTIELLSCYLTPTDHTHLSPLLHASLGTTTLTFPHVGTPLTVHANGDVRTIDTSPESDESVLHLGPKRKRGTPLGALDPETQRQLAIAATEALHQHGSLDAQQLSPLVSRESLPQKVEATSVKAAVSAARERLRASGQLWTPHYAGASRSGRFDLAEPDELTVWLWWQAASRPEVSAQELAREAVLAGFTSYAEMPAFAREAIDAAVQDGRRHRPGDPSHGAAALGRLLEAGVASDRDLIKKIIHAMAWSDKTATAEELAARLLTEAVVTGSAAELETLARGVVGNADRAGDRLVQLSVTDPAQAPAAMDRALGIVSGTPRLREPERLSELVKHLRIRHITGPQRAVEEFAARVRQEGITAPAGVQEHQRTSLEPLTLRERMLDVAERDDRAAIDELALKVVSALGNTDRSTLVATLVNKGVKKESVRWEVLDRALEQARTEGWLWHPIHAGREGRAYGHLEGFTPEEPTRLTAFLWLQAITHPTESSLELAHRAYRAGFTDNEELRVAVELALAAAVRDGRRYPDLMISDPAHRDGIRTLISALVAHRDPAKPPESVLSFRRTLRDYNIRGGRSELDKEIAYARRESDLSANAVTKPGVPELSLERKFAGRVLDANALADHSSIRALAYAAATMYKSAASDRLRQVLGHAGVITRADPAAESDLRLLIEDAAAEATANGDRLETLTITDEADRELVLARAVGVLRSAPELHARGDVAEVVAHLRMRHISGPHTALENLGRGLLSTPFDNLSAPGTVPHFAPVVRAHKPSFTNPADQPALIESARKLVEQHGGLDSETLRVRLTRTNAERTGTYPTASIAKQQADDEGWLWSPTYRGVTKLDDEGHRQAMLWQLAVDRPRATASDILQLAEQAGLARTRDMPALAREAVTAAVADQRRHPLLHITTDEHKPQVHALIDAVLLTEPELGVEATVLRLYEHNLRGTRERVRKAVRDRQAAPAEHPPDETRKLAAANTLTLNRKGTFYGRTLRSDVPEDRVTIEKLAYAVVWAHKTDTPSELARRLEDNGVIAEPDALAGIVTSAIRLADHHGDRLQRLSADLPTHREAIRRRTLDIAIAQPDSRGLSTPDLVRLMRQRNITGSRNHLRQDADTVRALLARPTPHAATGTELGVPVDFGGHEVRVIPRRHGAGFVTESFGRHILNARVPEQEGVFDLFAAQRNDYYFLPGYRSGVVPSTPDRFLAGLAGLPAQLVAWSAVKEIRLWACDLDTRHVTHLNRLVLDPAFAVLGHVTITAARPGEPILIAPDGRIHTADDGTLPADTLHLGRKRKIDETSDARTGSGVADAATKKKVIDTAKALFHDFGNVSVDGLAPLTRQQGVEALKRDDYRKLTGQAKQELEASDDLWTPVYRGASRRGVFDPERPDELTTWLFWQVSSSPDAGGPDLAMTAQKAGFTNSRTELHGYARQAAKIVEDDRLRLGLGADDRIPAFLGRSWDVEVDSDRRVLAKIAYAAAWSDKTADAEALTDLLSSRGVTGPREKLLTLVTAVTEEATRNGDRLGPLSVADPAQQAELVDRALGIVFGTPGLREPARLGEFVKHLRTRHVNGSQEDLRRFAADVQGIPDLPSEPQFVPGRSLLPLTLRGVRLASSDAVELKTVEDLARRIVVEEGLRGRRTVLMNQLAREIGARETGLDAVISRAVERVKNEGLAWHPVHRGHEAREYRHRRGFSPAEPTELTAFLWLLVVDHPRSTATEIVRRAEDAGFADSDELHLAVTQAMVAAVRERRRHPTLSLARPEHRPAIDTLIAGLHAAAPEASDVEIQRRLRSYNVAGQAKSLNLAIKDGRTAPGTPAALPVLRSGGTFAGRALDIDVLTDVEAIARLAYAAACADKTADVGKLVHRLAREGVTGSHEALTRLVTDATTEAARNGDRLETLSITDIADEDAIRSRVLGILHSEPALRVPDRLYDLVTHLRMRHITGPHQVMEDLARDLRDKAPAQRGEPPFAPIRRLYGFVSATIPKQRVDELAREVVAEHGALSVGTLADYLEAEGISSAERTRAIMRAVQRAKDEGSLWFPTYRGIAENSDAGHLDAVLWQLVIDHPRLGPLEIARLTEHAGFAPTRTRRREAELAIAAAEKDRRRHPLLQVADHATDARVNELIDALLLTEPGLDTESQVLRSFEYNLSGREREIREQVGNRKLQLPSTTPDPGVLARAREILAPHPVWTFRGRKLDTGHPAHFATIGMVAYAAAWAHKTENSEELVERLIRNGVSGSREALSRFATAAIAETIHHGDRMARLSADLSPHEIFIHDRLSWIVRKIPGFDQLDGPRRVTALVQAMRTHRITGSRQAMRAMVETYLGEHVVSAPFPTEPSRTIPLPGNGGMAFVPSIPNTLDGAPKRRRDGTTAADPQDPQTTVKLAGTTAEILQRYGALATSHLVTSIPHEVFPYRTFGKQITLHFEQERKRQADSGTLWSPLYRGRRGYESYDKDELNDLTAWLYRKVVADQTSSPTAIARSAAEAGFTTGTKQLLGAARAAMEAAALDGRRHPYLILGKPEHRVRIVALLDRILVNTDRRAQVQTLASLNDLNVHGHNNLLRALITEREQALKDDPALAEAARRLGLPTLRPSGAFLGRFLDVAKAADRGWIDKLAYAAAWEHKTATADELTRLLRDEGITGDPGLLREIVTTVIGEATRQGDRLPLLDATDQGQHAAIHARTAAIVNATPALYASTGTALVTHMRTRHITGPQHDLETIAQTILETPAEKLTQDYSLTPLDLDYLPSAARAIGAETEPTGYGPDTSPAIEALATTAKQLLLDFGDLNISYLTARWPNPSGKNKPSFKEMSEHLTTERARLLDSGELWLPTYRRLRNSRKDDHTDDLTAWLYRQVVTDRTKSPTAIASSAAAAGFATGYNQLVGAARAAMEAATNDGRRHVYLRIAKPDHRDRIITLIDRILANTPSPTRHQVINSLHEVNVHGDYSVLHGLVSERRQALQDDPALAEAARQLGLPTLRPTGAFRGRFLDTANEADHSWIDSLAYAAAWEHKTATVEHLVTLLTQEGIRDTNGGLTPLVARVLAEADANGDRHTTLSTHRPADHTAILRRTGTLVLKNHHALFPLDPNKATTRLVRHMRRNHITGTQDTLRNIAHTVYTLPTHQPLPGTHTIPLPTHDGHTVTAIPLPGNGGIAFIPATYATNVLNAFPHPEPGVFRLITQHRQGVFALPAHPHPIPHRPDQLIRTLHRLPPALANWGDHTTITLLACDLTPTHRDDLAALIHTNLGLELTVPHTETPLYITPDGTITTTDPGLDNTLHLAPPDTPTEATLTTTGAWRRTPGTTETFKQFLLDNNHATTTDLTPNKTGKLPPRGQALVKNWAITTGAENLSAPDTAEQSGGLVTPATVFRWRRKELLERGEAARPDADTLTTTGAWRRTPGTTETLKDFLLTNNHATTTDLTPDARGELPPRGQALVKNWAIATGAEYLSGTDTAEQSGGLVSPATVFRWRRKELLERGEAARPDADTLTTTGAWRRTPGTTETLKQFLLTNNHATTTDLTPNKTGELPPRGQALVKNWAITTGAENLSAPDTAEHSGGLVTPATVFRWRRKELLERGEAARPDADTLTTTGAWRRPPGTTETFKQFLLTNNHATETGLTPDARGELPPRGQALVKNWAITTGAENLSSTDTAEHSGGLVSPASVLRWRQKALLAAGGTELPDSDTLTTTSAWRRTPGTTETLKQFLLHNNHATTTDLTPNRNNELPPRGHALVKNWVLATATGDRRLKAAEAAEHSGGLVTPTTVYRWRTAARPGAEPAATSTHEAVSQLQIRPSKRRKTLPGTSGPEFVIPADIREFVVGFDPEKNRSHPSLWALLEHLRTARLPGLDLTRDSAGLPTSITTQSLVRDWATARAPHYPGDWIAKMSGWSISPAQAEELSGRIVTQREIRTVWEDQGRRRTELAAPEGPADTYVSRALRYGLRPIHGMDDMFYWRDPADPLYKVAPRFAGPDGDIHPVIRANADKITAKIVNGKNNLKRIAADPDDHKLARTDAATFTRIFRTLEENLTAEIRRIVRTSTNPTPGTITEAALGPTDPDRPVYVGQVLPEHVAAHEQRLVGQLGLYLTHPPGTVPHDRQPALRNGRVLGIYAGAHLGKVYIVPSQIAGRHDLENHWKQRHPHYPAYNMHAGRGANPEQITAEGAGNSTAFANSATLPTGGIDQTRVNTVLLDIEVTLPNKNNPAKTTTIGATAYIALDNAFDPTTNPHGTILVDYSDHYEFTRKEKTFKREDPDPPTRIADLPYHRSIDTDGGITTSRPQ